MRRAAWVLVVLAIVAAGAMAARLLVGETWGWPGGEILELRAHRMVTGAAVGVALAVAGALLQALMRNPLASPYVVGISSGATLGVMLSWTGLLAFLGPVASHTAALCGALATMAAVYGLSQRRGRIDPLGLLLVGVIVNSINAAAMMFLTYITPYLARAPISTYMLGYISENVSWLVVWLTLGMVLVSSGAAWSQARALDVATFSDAEAHSLGVNLPRVRLVVFLLAGLLTSSAVVLAGPIGFVGLICPHFVRLLVGPSHRPLILGSALAGVVLVVGADTAVKLIETDLGAMPIGVVTALIGGPVFLFMLRPHLGRGYDT